MLDYINLSKIKKIYGKIFIEFLLNILAFSLLIMSQQLIAFPLISRFTDAVTFGQIILIFGIGNIIISMLGTTLGTARILDNKQYNLNYIRMLFYSSILVLIVSFLGYYKLFENDIVQCLLFSSICILGSIRGFLVSEYRITNSHNWIFKQNFVYFIGILIGCLIYYFSNNWLIIFIIPEIISVSYCLFFLINDGFLQRFKDNSKLRIGDIIRLMFNNGLSYSLNQYDRLVIFPILGAAKVSNYFTVTISSRIGALVLNPLSNFILGKISNKSDKDKKIIKTVKLLSIGVMVVYFFVAFLTTPVIVKFLYPNFYSEVYTILVPVCIGAALSSGNTILKPIVMKNIGIKSYNRFFIIYAIILVVSSIIMTIFFDLIGIALSYALANMFLYLILLLRLKKFNKCDL